MTIDTSEKGLEAIALVACEPPGIGAQRGAIDEKLRHRRFSAAT
jgi:hypothetical protein